jgi:hypothetical protein
MMVPMAHGQVKTTKTLKTKRCISLPSDVRTKPNQTNHGTSPPLVLAPAVVLYYSSSSTEHNLRLLLDTSRA